MSLKPEVDILASLGGNEQFLEALISAIASASEADGSVSIALVDLDAFGKLNEEQGEEAGDRVLGIVAKALTELDLPDKEVFRRRFIHGDEKQASQHKFAHGGDEFLVLLPGVEKEEAFLALERERAAFAENKEKGAQATFSAAVATYPEDGTRPQDVLRKAHDALYRAKSGGRNKVCLAREERMVTKTSHYTQAQLARLSQLAKREGVGEAVLLREGLDELLMKYGV